MEEIFFFVKLVFKCCELRKRDCFDLVMVVLLEFNRIRDFWMSDDVNYFYYYYGLFRLVSNVLRLLWVS